MKHSHYFKDVSKFQRIDVYRVLELFKVTDPCIQHAVKKLLVAGGRGAGKDIGQDIQEAIDTLQRWQVMRFEETLPGVPTGTNEVLDIPAFLRAHSPEIIARAAREAMNPARLDDFPLIPDDEFTNRVNEENAG